jgi:flagellar hook assembly protein FlgD
VGAAERSNWQSAAQDAGWATPTVRNSQFNDSEGQHDKAFSLRYTTFSPDGDGYRDVLFIDYSLPEADYEVAITVYDVQGRVVKDFGKNILLGASGSLSWDGTRNNGQRALSGLFIVYIQAYSIRGNVMTYKLPCAIAVR